jgi:uncharacterized membrane protein YfcA
MELKIFGFALLTGALGSMLGIGGGVLLIPVLTVMLGLPIHSTIGASIVGVIATSTAAGVVQVERGLSHTRLAMVLEIATTLGAIAGGLTAVWTPERGLEGLLALVLVGVVWEMGRGEGAGRAVGPTGIFDTEFVDPQTGQKVRYGICHFPVGMATSFLAGAISGLLGIGGGIIKVPMMTLVMGMPLRAAIATANLMIGVTAATSAIIYYNRGFVQPSIAVPVALGILVGAQVGVRVGGKLQVRWLRLLFRLLLLVFSIQMAYKALLS